MNTFQHVRVSRSITNVIERGDLIVGMKPKLKDVVKRRREALNLTQEALAKRAGVSQSTVGNVESGARTEPRKLPQIARALGTTVEELLLEAGEPLPLRRIDAPGRWPFSTDWNRYKALQEDEKRDLDEYVEDFIKRREARKGGHGENSPGAAAQ